MNQSPESLRVEPEPKSYIIHFKHPATDCERAGETASILIKAQTKQEALKEAQAKYVACPCGVYYQFNEAFN